jgi:hypothetical protein
MVHRLTTQWSWSWYPHAWSFRWWHPITGSGPMVLRWELWRLDCGPLSVRFRRRVED